MTSKRTYIEFLRIYAAFMVIVNHTAGRIFHIDRLSRTWYAAIGYYFASKVAVPLFLMIMGALLLERRDPPKKSVQRIARMALVTLLFSGVYYVCNGVKNGTVMSASAFLAGIFREPATNAFWYLYLYLGLLCMLPVFQAMAQAMGRRETGLLVFLSLGVCGGLPVLPVLFPGFAWQPDFTEGLFSAYIGMVFAGLYVERYVKITGKACLAAALVYAALTAFQAYYTGQLYKTVGWQFLGLDDRRFLPITASAVCVYIIGKYLFTQVRWPGWAHKAVAYGGSLTFGVYLLSDLAWDICDPVYVYLLDKTHILVVLLVWEGAIFALSLLGAAAMKCVPGLKKLI